MSIKSKHKSLDLKLTAVNHYLNKSLNYKKTSLIFNCSHSSLRRWVKQFKIEGFVSKKIRKPISYKIRKKHVLFVKKTLKKEKQITIRKLHKN